MTLRMYELDTCSMFGIVGIREYVRSRRATTSATGLITAIVAGTIARLKEECRGQTDSERDYELHVNEKQMCALGCSLL